MATLLVQDGILVTQDRQRRVLRGDVVVEGSRIAAVGPDAGRGVDADHVIDARGGVVLPGFVNAHTHVAMTLFRGYGDDMELMPWLEQRIWPAEANLTAATTAAGARLGMLEMAASGTTTFADMYFFEDAIAEAVEEVGLRGFLGFSFLDFPTAEMAPDAMPDACRGFFERWGESELVTPTLAPHATYTCGPETLDTVRDLRAELHDPVLQVHCSETREEVYDLERQRGRRPVAQLAEHGLLGPGTVLAHCGWITKDEVRTIAGAGAGVAHCPVANMKLATGGFTPLPELLEAGAAVGVGTDGPASNNTLDLLETVKTAAILHKHHRWDATVVPAQTALDLATLGGARVLGIADQVGSLEVGKQADLVVVNLDRPGLQPLHDPVSQVVYAARGTDVAATVVAGRVVYENGAFPGMDAAKAVEDAQQAARDVTAAKPEDADA